MKKIKVNGNCMICGSKNTGFRYTCKGCTTKLPSGFYKVNKFIPDHIPEDQRDIYAVRYIRKYFNRNIKENNATNNK